MAKVKEIFNYLAEFAPVEMKMDFDNVGFIAGKADTEVKKALVSLDITSDVVDEAIEWGAELIVSHHPLFFSLKRVTDDDLIGSKIVKLIENGISAICMHTNLDAAEGGVNDALAKAVGIKKPMHLSADGIGSDGREYCIGRYGELRKEMHMSEYLPFIKSSLNAAGLRYYDSGSPVKRVAVVGGSGGGDMFKAIEKGCDTFVTADLKYNVFLDASELGINLIDGDHFCTENVVVPILCEKLASHYNEIEVKVSAVHRQTSRFM